MDDVVQIKKYPNRRLYDQTHSRHLTQEQLHEMVASGRRVRITDSTSGCDITNAILMQLLVDRDASRLAAIPAVFMHLLVQGQESLVRTSMDQSMRWFGEQARAATQPMDAWKQAAASFMTPPGWPGPMGWIGLGNAARASQDEPGGDAEPGAGAPAGAGASSPGEDAPSRSKDDEVAALRGAMGDLLGQLRTVESRLAELEHRSGGGGAAAAAPEPEGGPADESAQGARADAADHGDATGGSSS